MHIIRALGLILLTISAAVESCGPVGAQQIDSIKVGTLTLPVFAPVITNVMKAREFDRKHGLDVQLVRYPAISGYYAGFATGEVDALLGGPTYFQKLRLEGVPLKIFATAVPLSDLAIVTRYAQITTFADLKGKKLAADMGSGQYQILSIYARSAGIELGKDIEVINANFAASRAQLAAERVDAAMVIEPIVTAMMNEDPRLHIIFNADEAWKSMTGSAGWELVFAAREEKIKTVPQALKKFVAALKDTAEYMKANPDETDKIVTETVKLPAGIMKAVISSGRAAIAPSTIGPAESKSLLDMMKRAVDAGFHPKMPDEGILYVD